MKPMREAEQINVAHVLPWNSIGGTEHATLRIAQAAATDGFNSIAFCLAGESPVRDLFATHNFPTASYEAIEPSFRRPRAYLENSIRLAREFKRQNIRLVHCAEILAARYTALAGRLARVPVICHVRNRHNHIPRRDRQFLRPVSRFAFVSQDTWRQFDFPVAARKGSVIYDGLDVKILSDDERRETARQVRAEFDIAPETKIVGMVARVAPQKDYLTLVRAAARIKESNRDVRFLIVGDHSGTDEHRAHFALVRKMIDEHNVASMFTFTGFRADVWRFIGALDVFALATHFEGLPLVLIEAMAQGKPVVATAVDGIPEIVFENETGLLHKHEDDAELANKLLSLIDDEARAAALGANAQTYVRENFSRERFAQNIVRLYQDTLARRFSLTGSNQPTEQTARRQFA